MPDRFSGNRPRQEAVGQGAGAAGRAAGGLSGAAEIGLPGCFSGDRPAPMVHTNLDGECDPFDDLEQALDQGCDQPPLDD